MTLFIKEEQSILFLHVPKCGGSSIDRLFKDNGYTATLELRGLPPQDCLVASPQHLTSQNLKSIVNMKNLDNIFTIVRNPYERMISEFNWQFRDTESCNTPDINIWVVESLKNASSDLSYSDNHFRPSIDFIDQSYPCKIFKLEDGIEFIVEYFIREQGSTEKIDIPNEKNAKNFANSIKRPNLNPIAIRTINQFYKRDFEAFGYTIVETEAQASKLETDGKNESRATENKIKSIREWRDATINNLHHKTKQELRLLNIQISETRYVFNKDNFVGELDHNKIQKSIDSRFDEILVKLNYSLLNLNLLKSPEQSITSSEASNLIQLANKYRDQIRLKVSLSSLEAGIKK